MQFLLVPFVLLLLLLNERRKGVASQRLRTKEGRE